MALMLPGWLEEALQFTGYTWPSTNEDLLSIWGSEWQSLSQRAAAHADQVEGVVAYVGSSNTGPAADAFTGYMRGESNLAALRDFATATALLGQACEVGAGIVTTLKNYVIAQLVVLAAAIAAAVGTGGLASAAVLLAREVAKRLVDAAVDLALAEILG